MARDLGNTPRPHVARSLHDHDIVHPCVVLVASGWRMFDSPTCVALACSV